MDYDTLMQILGSHRAAWHAALARLPRGPVFGTLRRVDIGLEGKMLSAATMAAATVAFMTGSAWAGLGAGIVASMLFSALHGLASITFKGNQLISGVALNFLASGLTVLIAQAMFSKAAARQPWWGRPASTRSPCRFTAQSARSP